jgi:hypothetical protein
MPRRRACPAQRSGSAWIKTTSGSVASGSIAGDAGWMWGPGDRVRGWGRPRPAVVDVLGAALRDRRPRRTGVGVEGVERPSVARVDELPADVVLEPFEHAFSPVLESPAGPVDQGPDEPAYLLGVLDDQLPGARDVNDRQAEPGRLRAASER